MKTIGLLGGMSWQSSIEYERMINEGVRDHLGGTASADLLIRSYNFAEIERYQEDGRWDEVGQLLADDAASLERAGADAIVLCTNTMHLVAPAIEAAIGVPFLHLADTTAEAIVAAGLEDVALLGTRYTMEHDFYKGRLEAHGLTPIIPDEPDRTVVHDVIFDELVQGVINDESRTAYLGIIDRLLGDGATGVIAGCTEIEMLIEQHHLPDGVPLFPTTRLHAEAAVRFALS